MRIIHEGSLFITPAIIVASFVLEAPRSGTSTLLWPLGVFFAGAAIVLSAFALRRPALRVLARGLALGLVALSAFWSLAVAAGAAAWTLWALLEISLDDATSMSSGSDQSGHEDR